MMIFIFSFRAASNQFQSLALISMKGRELA